MMHGIVWRRFLTISDPTFISSIQAYHEHNDTSMRRDRNIENMKADLSGIYEGADYWSWTKDQMTENFPGLALNDVCNAFSAHTIGPAVARDLFSID